MSKVKNLSIDDIMTPADEVMEKQNTPPEKKGATSKRVSKKQKGGKEMDDNSFSIALEKKVETKPGTNVKLGRMELYRPAEYVKVNFHMNFDKRKITYEEAFQWMWNTLDESVKNLPVEQVGDTIRRAGELVKQAAPMQTATPQRPPQQSISPKQTMTTETVATAPRQRWIRWEQRPIADLSEWVPRSPFKESTKRPGFFHCTEREADPTELAEIKLGQIEGAWYSPPSGNFQGRIWYRRE
jgi:hypothetical protein